LVSEASFTSRQAADEAPHRASKCLARGLPPELHAAEEGGRNSRSTIHNFLKGTTDSLDKDVSWRRRVWILMEEPSNHPLALGVHYCHSVLVMLSVCSILVMTIDNLSEGVRRVLTDLELFFNTLFTLEVLARVVCAPQKILLLRNMYMWMDVGAILPFYIILVFKMSSVNMYLELVALLIPILRLLKITRHSTGWRILMHSIVECAEPLCVPAFLLLLMTVIASCVIFWVEKHFIGDADEMAFESIPHAMWFVICTISTVGYGDVSPNSGLAKAASAALILGGVCYMAMPLAIIGGTFVNVWQERERILMREKTQRRFAEGGITPGELRMLFEAADQDHSGSVKRSEFVELVEAFQLGMTRGQILKLFKGVDSNGSGDITFDEFSLFLFPELEIPEDCSMQAAPSGRSILSFSTSSQAMSSAASTKLRRGLLQRVRRARTSGDPAPETPATQHSAVSSIPLDDVEESAPLSLVDRVERLERVVARLAEEQARHLEAQRRILGDLSRGPPREPPSVRRASSGVLPPEEALLGALPGAPES